MRHKYMLFFIFLLLLNNVSLISQVTNSSNTFSISSLISTNKVPLNKNFKVTIEIKITGDMRDYIVSTPFIDKIHNMEIVGTASENTTLPASTNKVISIKKYIYTMKPTSIGMAYFPKVLVSITDKKTGELVSQLDTPSIPIEILEPIQKKSYKIVYIIISILIIFALFIFIYLKYKKSVKDIKENTEEEKDVTIEDKYYELLKQEESKDILKKEKINIFVKLLKGYIEEKYNLKIRNKAYNEIKDILSNKEIVEKERILNILKETDLIKYAQEEPDNKVVDNIINTIMEIIKSGGDKQ